MQLTGVPVRVAIGPTKTLGKVAALGIKKVPNMNGVLAPRRYSEEQLSGASRAATRGPGRIHRGNLHQTCTTRPEKKKKTPVLPGVFSGGDGGI